jgi:hypothetical protein
LEQGCPDDAVHIRAEPGSIVASAKNHLHSPEVRGQQKQRLIDLDFIANEHKATFCSSAQIDMQQPFGDNSCLSYVQIFVNSREVIIGYGFTLWPLCSSCC